MQVLAPVLKLLLYIFTYFENHGELSALQREKSTTKYRLMKSESNYNKKVPYNGIVQTLVPLCRFVNDIWWLGIVSISNLTSCVETTVLFVTGVVVVDDFFLRLWWLQEPQNELDNI